MSLQAIGIRDFPFLHRQFSSPSSKFIESPATNHDIARDSKDVLIQRLQDLANQLVTEDALKDEEITALHLEVDRMEKTMWKSSHHSRESSFQEPGSPHTVASSRRHEEDFFWAPFASPSRKVNMRFPDSPVKSSHANLQKSLDLSAQKATLLAQEAESLRVQLSTAVAELQARKEETNHIHDLLITRAETAAQRIIDLESQVQNLDADFEASQSELSFLRIQLRALEVQGLQYIPFNADKELSESIKNWKMDWADIDQRTKARRKKCRDAVPSLDSSTTIFETP